MTHKPQTPIPAEALLTVTTGCYSDYYVRGVFRAKEELDVDTLFSAWRKQNPNVDGWNISDKFIRSILDKLEPVECFEFWLDDDDYFTDTFSGITP